MEHKDHVDLLRAGVPANMPEQGSVWADLGAGAGAFTLALADLLKSAGQIYVVDTDQRALNENKAQMNTRFPAMRAEYLQGDFTKRLELPALDGIVMANSLHFVRHKGGVLELVHNYLKPGGRLMMVEYNADSGNMWVPFPFSYNTWEKMAHKAGFINTKQIGLHPSRHMSGIYSAVSFKENQ